MISPDWSLTAGLRFDHYSDFGSTVNPRFSLVWTISEQLNAKLLYGRAFRAPSFREQKQQNSNTVIGNPNLKPETINTVELAFDYRPLHNLRLASNVYFYDIDNLIDSEVSKTNAIRVNNTNTIGRTGYGTEFEWDWNIYKDWNLKGNYAWQYSNEKETHHRVYAVPEHQVYVALAWRFLPKWQLQTQLNWIGHRLNHTDNKNNQLKDYQTVDITLNSQRFFGYIDFSASIRNAFNSRGKEASTPSYKDNLPIASRSFYLETTLHF
jgi:iron complex outermembrane receptor protein